MKPTIVHISADYPDALQPRKTKAIQALVDGTPEFRHVVYSLNRYNAWSGTASIPFGEDRVAVAYGALPKGILWEGRLRKLAQWIEADLRAKDIKPDVIEAHKFTVEGLIAEDVAIAFSCPLICDIQGGSDERILRVKYGLRRRYRAIAKKAALVFPFAPWSVKPFVEKAGLDPQKCMILPVIPGIDSVSPAPPLSTCRLITVFDLDRWKIKNLDGVCAAVKILANTYPNITVDVYGHGQPQFLVQSKHVIECAGVADRVFLRGGVANGEIPALMKTYNAFVMPTRLDTYGLVFIEALFSGVPVLYSREKAIDGFFPAEKIGYACNPYSVSDIVKGIKHLLTHEAELKESIAKMQQEGAFNIMRKEPILATYRAGLNKVLNQKCNG